MVLNLGACFLTIDVHAMAVMLGQAVEHTVMVTLIRLTYTERLA